MFKEHNYKFCKEFKTKKIQSPANVQNDGHKKSLENKISKNNSKKIFSPKMEKETKIVELFTVSLKILSSSCARQ